LIPGENALVIDHPEKVYILGPYLSALDFVPNCIASHGDGVYLDEMGFFEGERVGCQIPLP